jgi:hypothetical protein
VSSDIRTFGIDHAGEIVLSVIFGIRIIVSRSRLIYKCVTFLILLVAMYEIDMERISPFGPAYFHDNLLPAAFLLVYVVYAFVFDHD